jgi:hypothetical protein
MRHLQYCNVWTPTIAADAKDLAEVHDLIRESELSRLPDRRGTAHGFMATMKTDFS